MLAGSVLQMTFGDDRISAGDVCWWLVRIVDEKVGDQGGELGDRAERRLSGWRSRRDS